MPKDRVRAAGIYCRISLDADGDALGVRRQEQDCRELADRRGWPVAQVFKDNDVSAHNGKPRPAYRRMLEAITSGEIDAVLTWHLDRLHRRPKELEEFVEACARANLTNVATVTGDFNVGNDDGLFQARILTAVAAKEGADKGRRVRRKHLEMARAGRAAWGVAIPFGYRWDFDSKSIIPDPVQAPEVKRIFAAFSRGQTLRAIARDLTGRGVKGQRGRTRWSNNAVGKILEHPTYAGFRTYNGEITEGTWEPIIDRATWDTVRAMRLASKAARPAENRKGKGNSLLSGILLCSCGAPMWRSARSVESMSTYECSKSAKKHLGECRAGGIAAHRVEEHVTEAFLTKLSAPFSERARARPAPTKPSTTGAEAELARIDQQLERAADVALESPGFTRALRAKVEKLEARRAELAAQAEHQEAATVVSRQRAAEVRELQRRVKDLPAVWEVASIEERNQMFRAGLDRVDVVAGQPRLKAVAITWAAGLV